MSLSSYTAAKIQKLLHNSRGIMRGAELVRQEIFGHVPQLNIRRGTKIAKQGLTGPYLARYYPLSINTVARKIFPGWLTEQEEYRKWKLNVLRRKGKGPPKKGAGSRKKKK